MKALLRGGWCLALGMLASQAMGQEWRAANSPVKVRAASPDDYSGTSFRPSLNRPEPIVRGQAPDDMKPLPTGPSIGVPTLFTQAKTPAPPAVTPGGVDAGIKPMPREGGFVPPAPQPIPVGTGAATPPPSLPGTTNVWGGVLNSPIEGAPLLGLGGDCPNGSCAGGPLLNGCASCNTGCGDCCIHRPHCWVGAEYLMWWTNQYGIPPLVTTSTANVANAGALGVNGTSVLFDEIEGQVRSGGRLYGGWWFSNCWGIDASYWFLGERSSDTRFSSDDNGNPLLGRPIIVNGQEQVLFVSSPNTIPGINTPLAGSINIRQFSRVSSFDVNLRRKCFTGCNFWLDGLIGWRYFNLQEGLDVAYDQETQVVPGAAPFRVDVFDSFRTRNVFNGGQVGVAGEWRFANRWTMFGSLKLALGDVQQTLDINGQTRFTPGNNPVVVGNGGVLALVSNIGKTTEHRFAVMPEFSLKIGYNVTDHLRLYAGYDFVYVSNVLRPGDQIDRNINRALLPSALNPNPAATAPLVPARVFRTSDFWAQGLNFGAMYTW